MQTKIFFLRFIDIFLHGYKNYYIFAAEKKSECGFWFKIKKWSRGRVARQWIANPSTAVRIRPRPPLKLIQLILDGLLVF
jgi:hypothetical protein